MKTKKASNAEKKQFKPAKQKNNLIVTIAIVLVMTVLIVIVYFILKNALQTEKYYVLNQNISARTRIDESMLEPIEVSKNGSPPNAINIGQIQSYDIYSRIPLEVGDTLTATNTGLSLDTSTGIPDDWIVTSLNISADKAVGGQINRGDYFDIIDITDAGAKYIAVNVLALDVRGAQSVQMGADGQEVVNNELQYIVGAPQQEVAVLIDAFDGGEYKNLRFVLSPRSLLYKERDISKLDGIFKADVRTEIIDLFEGTDSKFRTVLRDNNLVPVNAEYCEAGIIEPAELCDKLDEMEDVEAQDAATKGRTDSNIKATDYDEAEEEIKSSKEQEENEDDKKELDDGTTIDETDETNVEDEDEDVVETTQPKKNRRR